MFSADNCNVFLTILQTKGISLTVLSTRMTKCIHKSICNCFCNLIHKNAFEKHWHSYQHSTYSYTHYLLLFILISFCLWGSQNFFDTEIKEKVANEKNQKPMKQQNVWSMESYGGTCCGGGTVLGAVVRLLRLGPSAAAPLFARVICVNFDVWHRPPPAPPPTAETRADLSGTQQF